MILFAIDLIFRYKKFNGIKSHRGTKNRVPEYVEVFGDTYTVF